MSESISSSVFSNVPDADSARTRRPFPSALVGKRIARLSAALTDEACCALRFVSGC